MLTQYKQTAFNQQRLLVEMRQSTPYTFNVHSTQRRILSCVSCICIIVFQIVEVNGFKLV